MKFHEEMSNARQILRAEGLRGLFRAYGWKVAALVFLYYLVRDTILYLIIPYLVARQL